MAKAPNFLVLMADQLTVGALPFLGDLPARTPHLKALAAEGVVFASAYCASPLCGPSRFSMMAGQLPSRIGAYDNACELAATTPTFAHYLRAGGYRTILAGKMHFVGPDQLHGFEERLTTDIYPGDFSWTPDWTRPDHRPHWYHSMDSVIHAGPTLRTNQLDFDEEVVFETRRKLFDLARDADGPTNGGRPFLLVASLTHPHDPYAIHRRYWDMYEGIDIPAPKLGLGDVPLDAHSARLRHVSAMDVEPANDAQVAAARRAYLGAVSFIDEQMGAILATLRETGLDDNTIVVLCGDHGDMLGERGLWYKMSFFEGAARVPLVVSAPGRFAARRVSESVSLLDLLPTFCDLAGLPAPGAAPVDGRSLRPWLEGGEGVDEVLGEYMGEGALAPIVMIRRGPWKFIHSPIDADQLYNLVDDPLERANLAEDAAHAEILAELRAEAGRRWDLPSIHSAVLASQSRRRLVAEANAIGAPCHWDWQVPRDASRQYVRNHMDLEDLEARARFPRVR